MDELGARICEEARRWIGTPWVHQRYHKGLGCDCIGLVRGVAMALGIADASDQSNGAKPYLGYGTGPEPARMQEALSSYLDPLILPPASPDKILAVAEPGDVLWLGWQGMPRHVGFLLPGRHIIHAYSGVGWVTEHIIDLKWSRRLFGAFRFPREGA